ncbi:MAG: hypothetical protein ACI857_002601 [Arenicella sp.]|jgi:hypothetical protein
MSTSITSKKEIINASSKEVFEFLCDFNNIKELLPQDKISEWTSTVDDCSFKIQGAAIIPLIKKTVEPTSKINIVSGEKAPFSFTLVVHLIELDGGDGNSCEGHLQFEGDINAFLKMMVVKPLTNLFDYMAHKLQKKFEG